MMFESIKSMPTDKLFRLFSATLEELRRRELVRSSNSPVADYTEKIAAHGLGLCLVRKSIARFDAKDEKGLRYQIKGRRITLHNASQQLSFMRNIAARPRDRLIS